LENSFSDEARGEASLETERSDIENHIGTFVGDYSDTQRAEVASVMLAYIKDMRQVVKMNKAAPSAPELAEATANAARTSSSCGGAV